MDRPRIVIDKDTVVIEGVEVKRPLTMSPSQWKSYWGEKSTGFGAKGVNGRGPSMLPDHNP